MVGGVVCQAAGEWLGVIVLLPYLLLVGEEEAGLNPATPTGLGDVDEDETAAAAACKALLKELVADDE